MKKNQQIQCVTCQYRKTVDWKGKETAGCTKHNSHGVPLAKPPISGCKWYGLEAKP